MQVGFPRNHPRDQHQQQQQQGRFQGVNIWGRLKAGSIGMMVVLGVAGAKEGLRREHGLLHTYQMCLLNPTLESELSLTLTLLWLRAWPRHPDLTPSHEPNTAPDRGHLRLKIWYQR